MLFQTSPIGRRYIIASVIEEDGVPALEDKERLKTIEDALRAAGYKETELPEAENAVFAYFPWRYSVILEQFSRFTW